jgi:transcriptional regulator with XRE-family HTH domain
MAYQRQELIKQLLDFRVREGRFPTRKDFDSKRIQGGKNAFFKAFGSLEKAIAECCENREVCLVEERRKNPGSVFVLIDEPTYVPDLESFLAAWVQKHYGSPGTLIPPESARDKRSTVKRIWQVLNASDKPCDSASVDYRVELIRYLEKLMHTEFASTKDLRQHVDRYLGSHDGRRLPIPEAIKRARKKLKLSQKQLAEELGFKDHTLISKYENGERVPPGKVLAWLERAENVTGKRQVKAKGQTPSFPVTSSRGDEASISPVPGMSQTSPELQECDSAVTPDPLADEPAPGPATGASDQETPEVQ